jgi:hypothetical protein
MADEQRRVTRTQPVYRTDQAVEPTRKQANAVIWDAAKSIVRCNDEGAVGSRARTEPDLPTIARKEVERPLNCKLGRPPHGWIADWDDQPDLARPSILRLASARDPRIGRVNMCGKD